jgi:hypothetical protein
LSFGNYSSVFYIKAEEEKEKSSVRVVTLMIPVLIDLYYNAYRLYRTRLDIPPQTRNRATSPKSAIPQVPNLRFHKSQICDATSPKSAMPQAPNLRCHKPQICDAKNPKFVMPQVPNLWCHKSQICDATSPKSVMPKSPKMRDIYKNTRTEDHTIVCVQKWKV